MKLLPALLIRFLWASRLTTTTAIGFQNYREIHTDDAVILEASPAENVPDEVVPDDQNTQQTSTSVDQHRTKRQTQWAIVPGPCLTGRGALGKCVNFRSCYPYIKLPNLHYWESWVMGMYDACTYISLDHQQSYGVCCTQPGILSPGLPNSDGTFPSFSMPPSNWPPPLPTHPTHPAHPTHTPPSPQFPGWPPQQHPQHINTDEVANANVSSTTPSNKPNVTPPSTENAGNGQYECGIKNVIGYQQDQERIVGGQNAEPGEWPWIVAIFNSGRHFCGGSLIDDSHILTAAHCVAHMSSWDVARLSANLGDYNIKSKSDVKHLERRIKRVVRHKGFNQMTLYNDIAILTLDKPVTFSREVHPICLPQQSKALYSGQQATVIGWGSLRESGPQPAVLQKVSVPVWTNQECKSRYGSAAPGGIVEHFLCAGKAAKDSCSGDSGGPLMLNENKWTQVGIVSWGIGCGKGQFPGVYTRVTSFMPWIMKNLKT
ncbi:proclotting enzyme-like [Adelges cooleyi]|uniref:proclotting enzyme-like n=1 Tax=Adelges cooleyi TaxID=133065 RepID=UPI00217FBAEB|nr:proclotting enzyme-like [Adelges cooleyi]